MPLAAVKGFCELDSRPDFLEQIARFLTGSGIAFVRGTVEKRRNEISDLAHVCFPNTVRVSYFAKPILALFRKLSFFRTVNRSPQFSAALANLLAMRGVTQSQAAERSGLSRQILIRLLRGAQWPQPEHIAGVFRIFDTDEDRQSLLASLHGDVSAAAGIDRFSVAEDAGIRLMRVPAQHAGMVDNVLFLYETDSTARIAVDSVIGAFLRQRGVALDTAHFIAPPKRKNTGAPAARPSLPPKPKAS